MMFKSEKISKKELLIFFKEKKNYIKDKYNIEIVALFASMARGYYIDKSDIDLLYKPIDHDIFKLIDSIEFLEKRTNRKIELISQTAINPIIEMTSKEGRIYV